MKTQTLLIGGGLIVASLLIIPNLLNEDETTTLSGGGGGGGASLVGGDGASLVGGGGFGDVAGGDTKKETTIIEGASTTETIYIYADTPTDTPTKKEVSSGGGSSLGFSQKGLKDDLSLQEQKIATALNIPLMTTQQGVIFADTTPITYTPKKTKITKTPFFKSLFRGTLWGRFS